MTEPNPFHDLDNDTAGLIARISFDQAVADIRRGRRVGGGAEIGLVRDPDNPDVVRFIATGPALTREEADALLIVFGEVGTFTSTLPFPWIATGEPARYTRGGAV